MFHDSVCEIKERMPPCPNPLHVKNKQECIRAHIRTTEYIDLDGDECSRPSCVGVDSGQKKFENLTNGQVTLPSKVTVVTDRVDA